MRKKSTRETKFILLEIRGLKHGVDRFHSYSALNHFMFMKTLKYHSFYIDQHKRLNVS